MCGIVGIFNSRNRDDVNRDLLQKMNDVQFRRGPDGEGLHLGAGIGLGHRRLSIIDIAGGAQPMYSDDKRYAIVFNGEVYNFKEMREELIGQGFIFHSRCDTEVVLKAYIAWGPDCVNKFRGMFALAIWDEHAENLFIVRDRLGIKPLFYTLQPDGRLLFASELKSLLVDPTIKRDIDPQTVEDYFAFGYVPEPRSIFNGINKLPPGHTLTIGRGDDRPLIREYWDVPFKSVSAGDERAQQEELIHRLKEAVDIRMIADVPLGSFLSGGVDSSAIVSLMSELSPDPVDTCSISFGDPKWNEAQFAQQVADHCKTRHHVEQVDPNSFDLIDTLVDLYDEPYADSSAMPTYRVCELARKHVTVALSGDGGDENLAGYRRHRWAYAEEKVRRLLPAGLRGPVFGFLGRAYPKADWAPQVFRAKSTFQSLARNSLEGYLHSVSIMPTELRQKLFSDSLKKQLDGYTAIEVFNRHAKNSPTDHPLSLVQYLDMKTYLPGDILTKVDRASMWHSLEVRVPLLDHKFVEWISGLSPDVKLKGREGKYIFKRSLESRLPHDILYRPKMGFAVPLGSWFKGPLRERVRDALLGETLQQTGFFDQKYLTYIVDQHQSGMRDFSAVIWALMMFEGFQRKIMTAV